MNDKGCRMAANIQIASEGLKNAGITEKEAGKILEKIIEKSSEAIKEVAEKQGEKVVYEWGIKASSYFFKVVPVLSSGLSLYNAYNKFEEDDKVGALLYFAEGVVGWIPGISYFSLIPSAVNTIKEISKTKTEK